ncbi:MAG: hypothetical protein V8T29_01390 [Oscillospiraceae bacterium]
MSPSTADWDGDELLLCDVLGTDGDLHLPGPLEDGRPAAHEGFPEREKRSWWLRFGLAGRREPKGSGRSHGHSPDPPAWSLEQILKTKLPE